MCAECEEYAAWHTFFHFNFLIFVSLSYIVYKANVSSMHIKYIFAYLMHSIGCVYLFYVIKILKHHIKTSYKQQQFAIKKSFIPNKL